MIDLLNTDEKRIKDLGRRIFRAEDADLRSFEEASQYVAAALYEELGYPMANPFFALVRIFRYGTYRDLPSDVILPETIDSRYWLTLTGSYGIEPDWCDRRLSANHKAIPADSPATPMLSEAFRQIGLNFGEEQTNFQTQNGEPDAFFHIPDVLNSPYVPDQETFVIPYQIRSVIGFGSGFLSRNGYLLIGFSLVDIDHNMARKLATLNPFTATLLAKYDMKRIWTLR